MLEKVQWAVQALMQPAEVQINLFPSFVNVADELALTWEEALSELENSKVILSKDQESLIKALDNHISSMSGPSNSIFWNIDALYKALCWKTTRRMAKEVALKMGWPLTAPSKSKTVYIGNPKSLC